MTTRIGGTCAYAALCTVLFACTGCYRYSFVDVSVIDSTTRQPLPEVTLEPTYHRFLEFFPPDLTPVVTDENGKARLRICTNYKSGFAGIYVDTDSFLRDEPLPSGVVTLPLAVLREHEEKPYELQIVLITIEAYRAKYRTDG